MSVHADRVRRPVEPDDLLTIVTIADVQLSPDGRRIGYVRTEIERDTDRYRSAIWVVDAEGGEPVRFTWGPTRDTAPRWSPDGRELAFLSDRESDVAQLYVMPSDGGEARRLTDLDLGVGWAAWSPDGTRIAFDARVPNSPKPKETEARDRWAQRPRHVTRAQYKADGQGYTFDARWHIFVVDTRSGMLSRLTRDDVEHRAPAWSPEGRRIAFAKDRGGVRDYSLFDLWVMDADGGGERRLTSEVGRATSPTWSPDGRTIACYGTDEQDNLLGDPMVRVWTVSLDRPAAQRLTAGYDRGAVLLPPPAITPGPAWSPDGASVSFIAADRGNAHLVSVALADGATNVVGGGERQVYSASAAAGRVAFIASDVHTPMDLSVRDSEGRERRRVRPNEELLASLALPPVERRTFIAPDGAALEGWVYRPTNAREPAPLLVDIHGGPAAFAGNAFSLGYFFRYVLASRGWAILALNPTGSGSYGRAFAHGIRGAWGERDLPQHLGAVDALVAEGIADPERLAVAGYSYGGFMTAWTIGHTNRFKAAVVGAPVVNQESMFGTSDIGMWFQAWELEVDTLAVREAYRRLSPVSYVHRVTTPTLVVHGEADDRCPIGQGEELFIGLLNAGVNTELVRYPGASHLFILTGRPSHRVDLCRRVVEWLERFVGAPRAAEERAAVAGHER